MHRLHLQGGCLGWWSCQISHALHVPLLHTRPVDLHISVALPAIPEEILKRFLRQWMMSSYTSLITVENLPLSKIWLGRHSKAGRAGEGSIWDWPFIGAVIGSDGSVAKSASYTSSPWLEASAESHLTSERPMKFSQWPHLDVRQSTMFPEQMLIYNCCTCRCTSKNWHSYDCSSSYAGLVGNTRVSVDFMRPKENIFSFVPYVIGEPQHQNQS